MTFIAFTATAAPPPVSGVVDLWARNGPNLVTRAVALDALPQVDAQLYDVQYGRTVRFRGVPLSVLLDRLPGEGGLVLAHFANGMIVPLLDARGVSRLQAFVATAVWVETLPGQGGWQPLPPRSKAEADGPDVRPLRFVGNKLVVKERWHPAVPAKAHDTFSPWLHLDALTQLERVSEAAFRAEFAAGVTPAEMAGRTLFEQRCRFCHGARKRGATFGWDFVEPVPLHTYRSPHSLVMHVRYRESDAPEKGVMMPQLSDLTEVDADNLWEWMRRLAEPSEATQRQ